jgi:hypothetical protein
MYVDTCGVMFGEITDMASTNGNKDFGLPFLFVHAGRCCIWHPVTPVYILLP